MRDYTTQNPEFAETIRVLEPYDPGTAESVNVATKQLLQNDLVLKKKTESDKQELNNLINSNKQELTNSIKLTEQKLNNTINSDKQELNNLIQSTKQELSGSINSDRQEFVDNLNSLSQNLSQEIDKKANSSDLKRIAYTADFNDLLNVPASISYSNAEPETTIRNSVWIG